VAVLAELRDAGVPVYALTNFSTEKFALARARFGFLDWFEGIVVSGEEGLVKPDPRIYRLLLDRYRLAAETTVYLDDAPVNVAAARALGLTGLRFTDPDRLRADLADLGLPIKSAAQN
jgi:2-haloacid dehalogenase